METEQASNAELNALIGWDCVGKRRWPVSGGRSTSRRRGRAFGSLGRSHQTAVGVKEPNVNALLNRALETEKGESA